MTKKNLLVSMVVLGLLGAAALAPISAYAFPREDFWHMPASGVAGTNRAGAGGIYGTGGRTDFGVRCSHCHTEGAGTIDVRLDVSPAFADRGGGDLGYVPGQRYAITVNMLGEHARMTPTAEDVNGFALTIEDASGRRSGRFVADAGQDSGSCPSANPYPMPAMRPAGRTTFMYGDCHAVLFLGHPHLTQWDFEWVAPAAGAGDLTLFVGLTDGDTGGDSSLHDDTVERTYPLLEGP